MVLDWAGERGIRRPDAYKQARWERRVRAERARSYYTAQLITGERLADGTDRILGLTTCDGRQSWYTAVESHPTAASMAHSWLHSIECRGALVIFPDGQRRAFHIFLRSIAPGLARQGFTIYPYASGADIRAIQVSYGKSHWLLCDIEAMCGTPERMLPYASYTHGTEGGLLEPDVSSLWQVVDTLQSLCLRYLGTGIRPTVGSLAVAGASLCLDVGLRWWHTSRLLAAFCRAGGAYRGGYAYGEAYRGPAWKLDINKAYTHALGQSLPLDAALSIGTEDGHELPGVYLCRVKGRGYLPAHLAVWCGPSDGFRRKSVWACDSLCFVPQTEYAGLRALGYQVSPLFGFRYTRFHSLAPYVAKLAAIQHDFPRGTWQHTLSKMLGNTLVGKLAESPERTDVCFAESPPSEEWWPYVDVLGNPIPYLWCRWTVSAKPYHHVDAAASITARVRGQVYDFAAAWIQRGGSVVHVDTDGLLVTDDPSLTIGNNHGQIGAWRVVDFDADCMVLGTKSYTWHDSSYMAGVPKLDSVGVEMVKAGKTVSVGGHVLRRQTAARESAIPSFGTARH